MIQMRTYKPEDYTDLLPWWHGHGVISPPEGCIPKLGLIAEDDGFPVFACWASLDNSCGLAFLVWAVSNPLARARAVHAAVTPTIDCLSKIIKDFGYHTLIGITHADSLVRQLHKQGFVPDSRLIRLNQKSL